MTTITEATMTLDVRDDIRSGREPFSRIMETVARLKEGESLRLIVPFAPAPLFDVMAQRGFSHASRLTDTGDWEVLFARPPKSDAPGSRKPRVRDEERGDQQRDLEDTELRPASLLCALPTSVQNPSVPGKTPAPAASSCGSAPVFEVDARGLEPPQPLVVILEALERLPEGAAMRACTDRRPLHLYAQLEERGFTGETEETHDGSFITTIRRA